MRIAFVTEVWHPTINGVVTRLTATIHELLRAGHQVMVVAPGIPTCRAPDGVVLRTVPTAGTRFVYGGQRWGLPVPRVGRYLAEFCPDVIHAVNPTLLGVAGVIHARRRRVPLVCSYHTDLSTYLSFYHLRWMRPALWRYLRWLHGAAARNLVTSASSAAQLEAAGIPRIAHWGRGVALDRFRPGPLRREAGAPLTALYVGRLAEEKDLGALAELATDPALRLVVVGDGPARAAIRRHLRSMTVEFRGALSGDDLVEAYRSADVFVFPSRTETLGLVLLEALACGLPVVAADSPASREVLGDCRAARRWTPGDPDGLHEAIKGVLYSADRATLVHWARQHVESLSWCRATAGLVDQYREAIRTVRQ